MTEQLPLIEDGRLEASKMLLKQNTNAVILSSDEILFHLSLNDIGDNHDALVEKIKQYFYKKSKEIIAVGANVILDFGFWILE